ncbi:hypothetical protein OG259_02130 [Streptomyces sp. NBC_00250]|uniref:WD40 repeat domain-containing protein n=1 Tax=Streptomyces sp. NBC_00250 TaxID=2903641 RepID=UPI002E2DDBB6|nr:hypothetical protein [Streptomyces sp. NBC_00250]
MTGGAYGHRPLRLPTSACTGTHVALDLDRLHGDLGPDRASLGRCYRAVPQNAGGQAGAVQSVALRRDGRTLATASWDGTAWLWDALTGKARLSLAGHSDVVYSVAFSPDGRCLPTGSVDRTGAAVGRPPGPGRRGHQEDLPRGLPQVAGPSRPD